MHRIFVGLAQISLDPTLGRIIRAIVVSLS